MTEQTSAKSSPKRARMSTPQMLHLMRLEVERAIRHGYPISCMYYGLDGFAASELLLHRRALMPLVFLELKKTCVENDVRGLGIWTEGFQLAVFPHVAPDKLQTLADSMLERARGVEHADVPDDVDITLSIGISHNLHEGEVTFESLVKDAESGMGMALASGGNQVGKWRAVESALDRLRDELDEQLREIAQVQEELFGEEVEDDELWGKKLVGSVLELFHREPSQTEGVLRLEKEVIALLKTEIASWAETSSANQLLKAKDHINRLERRVSKLTNSLSETEKELRRIAAMKNIDLGVASIYRTVQGLAQEDDHYEAKAEMLKNIFEANVALRAEMTSQT